MRTLLLCLFALTTLNSFAQYEIEKPYVYSSSCPNISIDALHIYPDKLVIDYVFVADYKNGGFRYSSDTYIDFKFYIEKYKVASVKNVSYNDFTYLKSGKKASFSATYPFSFYQMLSSITDLSEITDNIDEFPFLKMDIVNCTEAAFTSNPNLQRSQCFNFYDVDLGLKPDQAQALYLCGLLDDQLVKGEFETSAAFEKRNSPDSLKSLLSRYINSLEIIYMQKQIDKMCATTPAINYDADKEMFTLQFPNCEPVQLKMSIDKAPAFKKDVQNGTLKLESAYIIRKPDGNFYVKDVRFKDKQGKNGEILNNVIVDDIQKYYDATVVRVLAELKKIYPKGQIWK